ncbi:unnamed protein product, partial [Lymnaea stagnalis]
SFSKGGACSSRTFLEKVFLVLLLAVFAALVAVVVVLIVEKTNDDKPVTSQDTVIKKQDATDVCLRKDCVVAAARIEQGLDYSVKPCDNLYQFACGRWMKENVIPEDKASLTTFSLLSDKIDIVIKNLLEEPQKPTDLNSIKKAKDLYASCLNVDLINKRGDKPLTDLLLKEFDGWPLTNSRWNESGFDLVRTLRKLNQHGVYTLIVLYPATDSKNSSKRILKIDQTSFGMPGQKYYLVPRNDTMLMAYEDLIYGLANLLGFANSTTARNDVKGIVDFEIDLANISVLAENRRDNNALYNPMTLAEVQGNYSQQFDFLRFVNETFSCPGVCITDLTENEVIINHSPLYFQRLMGLLEKTPKKTVANYVIWRLIFSLAVNLGDQYKGLMSSYKKTLFGTETERARFRTCGAYTSYFMSLAVGRMFIKDNFDEETRNIIDMMITGIKASFNSLVDDLDWLDAETKALAKDKNEGITSKIGYPKELLNDTYLEDFYSNLTYNKDEYFENVLKNNRIHFIQSMRHLRQPIDKEQWDFAATDVNANYHPSRNQIWIRAGILRPPFFSKTNPMSLNFGGIGTVIGHEITHGFDDEGRQYDKNGNLAQWWPQTAVDNFKTKAQCIIDQYGNFTVSQINQKLNGKNTQGENIADNGGLQQAYK